MLRNIRNIFGAATLLLAAATALLAFASPAAADDTDYCANSCVDRYGAIDSRGYNPAGFTSNEAGFASSGNRLAAQQTGDQGYKWAVAGPKTWTFPVTTYNFELPASYNNVSSNWSRNEQRTKLMDDLEDACLKGNKNYWCISDTRDTSAGQGNYNSIGYIYFANALDYRTAHWLSGGPPNGGWVIYLQNQAGGLDFSTGWGRPGIDPLTNYGKVATVGEMRAFLTAESNSPSGSAAYRYNMARAVIYLDYVYGEDFDHPIELLEVPLNWHFQCVVPLRNADGSIAREWDGRIIMTPEDPVVLASKWARDPLTRALNCPGDEGGYWEYSYESEIGLITTGENGELLGPLKFSTVIEDESPSGVGRKTFDRQDESKLTPLGHKIEELCEAKGGCDNDTRFTNAEWKELKEAAEASTNSTGAKIDLTPNNVAALAEGRLVAVSEMRTDVRITRSSTADRYMRRWHATATKYSDSGQVLQVIETGTGEWEYAERPDLDRGSNNATFETGTPQWLHGYQIIVNHCDGDLFDSTVGSYSIDNRNITNSKLEGSYLAASAVSDVYNNPMNKPWGKTGPTSRASFFDKVCSYEGTRTDRDRENPIAGNDKADGTLPFTTYPRHGENDHLNAAYYTPTEGGWVNYLQNGPEGFTATRWEKGTPDNNKFWINAVSSATGRRSPDLFNGDFYTPPDLVQYRSSTWSSDRATSAEGNYKNLFTRAIWSSDRQLPQVLTVKWDFRPEIATMTPVTGIGFTGTNATYHKEAVGAEVRGQVYSLHGNHTVSPALRDAYVKYTGSDSFNGLDVPLFFGDDLRNDARWDTRPDLYSDYYYAVQYVRAVGD